MKIRFGLKAEPRASGGFRIVEWFEAEKLVDVSGRPSHQADGHIEECMKKDFAESYEAFHAYVEIHAETLYPAVEAICPKVLWIDPAKPASIPAEFLAPAEPEEKMENEDE